jgi:hypothetical protein
MLEMVNYLGKLIKNLDELTDKLRELQKNMFEKINETFSRSPVLRFHHTI